MRHLCSGNFPGGYNEIRWDGRDGQGRGLVLRAVAREEEPLAHPTLRLDFSDGERTGGWSVDCARLSRDGEHLVAFIVDGGPRLITAIVDEDQLSLAIGRNGQNVRLASQLIGWQIDLYGSREWLEKGPEFSLFGERDEDQYETADFPLAELELPETTLAALNAAGYNTFLQIIDLETQDFLRVEGPVWRTKKGELTIAIRSADLLAKSLRPLPEKWHGLTDVEARSRQRHLDLIANQRAREVAVLRSRVVTTIRSTLGMRPLRASSSGSVSASAMMILSSAWPMMYSRSLSDRRIFSVCSTAPMPAMA